MFVESIDATRAILLHGSRTESHRVIMITSAMAGEGKTSLACDAVDARTSAPQRIAAHQTLALDAQSTEVVDNDVNWVACRSLPGVSSRLIDGGSAGQCRAPAPLMQALAHEGAQHAP